MGTLCTICLIFWKPKTVLKNKVYELKKKKCNSLLDQFMTHLSSKLSSFQNAFGQQAMIQHGQYRQKGFEANRASKSSPSYSVRKKSRRGNRCGVWYTWFHFAATTKVLHWAYEGSLVRLAPLWETNRTSDMFNLVLTK